ncbi:lipid asymmetry maintenance ABC transporter permease subunit MlaE [Aquella oligotrophica]|uniref:Intermembrane phospholipid transport system permease protein MlaE n=1 Tax=Aquella oligotrophica TaxID=2067065 RepID=A0A2I7N4B8_9NEIS|nr:lipid asymmetry maintenance ABC transporter permease subunit MlaE [Aquella oligotrophica]AUR51303.1 ABC transporter permease [Aquella oligotrophica]
MKNLRKFVEKIGSPFSSFIFMLGELGKLLGMIILGLGYAIKRPYLIIKEVFFSGVLSILIIAVSGWFVGMVLGLQGYNTLQRFGSVSVLGSLVALALLRELGPVLSAILFASRAGSGITAEIGLMKATEQLDAMDVMAVNPIKRVIAPKFIGGIIAVPLLTALFDSSGILGGHFVGVTLLQLDKGTFWSQMQGSVSLHDDVINGLIKAAIFGVVVSLISVYQGLQAKPTAEGVSSATTRTVVHSALAVLALDFVLTAFMF